MGRILSTYQCTPRNCGSGSYYQLYAYDYASDVTSFNNAGLYALAEGYNSGARLTSVTSNLVDSQHPATIVNNVSYGPFGVASDSLGNGINESFGYAARGAVNSYSAGSVYSFSLGLASDYNIASANDSANGNWSYGYDQFNRIASAAKTGASFTYAYDRFGNRWQQNGSGGPTPQYSFDTNNHGAGNSYDVRGNVLNDGYHNYAYDAENRMISVDSGATTYVYDAFGQRVAKQSGGVSQEEYLYDLAEEPTTIFTSGGAWAYGEIYAGGRHLATYSGATTNFLHTDWLGNLRVTSNVSGGNSESCSDLPFGDNRSCSGTDWSWFHFTGDEHDSESNLEHTLFRQLSSTQGRWLSPDPAGMAAADLTNPQTLNLYAYVGNNPMSGFDPLGLYEAGCDDPDFAPFHPLGCGTAGGGGGGGGGGGPICDIYDPWNCPFGPFPTPGGGGSGGSGGGPAPTPNVNPSGKPPLSGETLGIPNGLHIQPSFLNWLLPADSQCEFGDCTLIGESLLGLGPKSVFDPTPTWLRYAKWYGCYGLGLFQRHLLGHDQINLVAATGGAAAVKDVYLSDKTTLISKIKWRTGTRPISGGAVTSSAARFWLGTAALVVEGGFLVRDGIATNIDCSARGY